MDKKRQIKRPRKRGAGRVMKVVSLSLSPEVVKEMEWHLRPFAKSRSQFIEELVREAINKPINTYVGVI